MPIIYRPGKPNSKDYVPLKDLPLDWDGNRVEISETNLHTQRAASAVCTFVKKTYLAHQPGKHIYQLQSKRTFEQKLRDGAVYDAKQKQDTLIKLFDLNEQQKIDAKKELAAFNEWAKPTTRVAAKFSRQIVPGVSTGFSIGENLVVTAGHCVIDAKGDDPITDYYAVFDMNVELVRKGRFPESQVYQVKRVVHRAIADDYDNPTAQKPSPFQPSMKVGDWARKGLSYDCAVIELVGKDDATLGKMRLRQSPVQTGIEVSLIGSPRGLPLKCSRGGRILEAIDLKWPDPANQPARQPELKTGPAENATFTADVDIFPGNSGGPLVQTATPSDVVGITRSGMNFPFSDSSLSSSKSPPGRLTNEWARTKVLNKKAIADAKALGFPLDKHGTRLGADIDASWLYGYEGVRLSDDAKYLYQHRVIAESAVVRNLNRFTRVDALSYFTSSLARFRNAPQSNVPRGQVSFSIRLEQWPDEQTMGFVCGLQLRINHRLGSFNSDIINAESSGWLAEHQDSAWYYHDKDPPVQPPRRLSRMDPGSIPHGACHSEMGIADWESVELIRLDNAAWDDTPADLDDRASLSLNVQYKRLADTSGKQLWGEEVFAFDLDLRLDTKKDDQGMKTNSLIGIIGKVSPDPMRDGDLSRDEWFIWKGPKASDKILPNVAPFI
ncbi:hypothetical protein CKM354_000688500 [Cercospora kikuchii]|uniref:Serine protease n=1 Tax=Cercospora kikuchii TaxID=84275 RepID=A0A9P3FDU7_9PEZI|nr:uncharacterized protein CKM354_000688500 [Cercospora kikuchii]GIZ43668.1 hypothetical protein CKM354_000688500 [Cercospora kikuchii]